MKEFLQQKIKKTPGNIVTESGEVLGQHEGLSFYTIGQRHLGMQISDVRMQNDKQPLFVVQKKFDTNELVVGAEDSALLYKKEIIVADMHWISGPVSASAALGSGPTDWACTRDNVTGLIWEVKTISGLRSINHTYTWYISKYSSNWDQLGTASGGKCFEAGRCDTEKYTEDVNITGLCGNNDWRMPKVKELEGIADLSSSYPGIDEYYFPNSIGINFQMHFWSGSTDANRWDWAWYVITGAAMGHSMGESYLIRLVRGTSS